MATKIRLQRHGRKGRPLYQIVVADSRVKRDGKFIDRLGLYNPTTIPATIDLDVEKALDWLQKGAVPTDTVNAILRFKGVLHKKHLLRGVEKGAFSVEEAEKKHEAWMEAKAAAIENRKLSEVEKLKEKLKASAEAGKEIAAAKVLAREKKLAAANEPAEEVEDAVEETVVAEGEVAEAVAEVTEEVVAEAVAEVTEEVVAEAVAEVTEEVAAEAHAAEEVVAEAEAVVEEVVAEEPVAEVTEEVVAEEPVTEEVAEDTAAEEGEEEKA